MMKEYKYLLTPTELAIVVNKTQSATSRFFRDNKYTVNLGGNRVGIYPEHVKSYLSNRGVDYSFRVISHINLRGGIGKTTASTHLATRAAQYGFNVALLDLDSQASTTVNMGLDDDDEQEVFIDIYNNPKEIKNILKEVQPNLWLMPSSLNNGLLDVSLQQKPNLQKDSLRLACAALKKAGFDLVVIDAPPSLGAAVISTICASDIIVIPVDANKNSRIGIKLCLGEAKEIRKIFSINMPEIKILFCRYDGREKECFKQLTKLGSHEEYGPYLLQSYIRTSSEVNKLVDRCETAFFGHKKSTVREDYDHYTRELLGLDRNG